MFDCQFIKLYTSNLNYVSEGLLNIINSIILEDSGNTYKAVKSGGNCVIPDPATDIEDAVLFTCTTWETIKNLLLVTSNPGGATPYPGYITILCDTLDCIAEKVEGLGHGLASQFERFACLCRALRDKFNCIVCNESCPEILGDFLCLLIQILTKLISAIVKASSLVYYADCDRTSAEANCVVKAFFDCIACEFVNDLCDLEKLINELNAIVIGFATCNLKECTPCYVAPCAPKKVRPICPPHMMNDGYGYKHRPGGGCGCSCNKGCKY